MQVSSIPKTSGLFGPVGHRTLERWNALSQGHKNTALFGINLATTVLKVFVFDKAYQAEGYSDRDRKLLLRTEWVRQLVSAGLWLGSSMLGLVASQRLLPQSSAMEQLLLGNLAAQVSDTLLRPVLTAKIAKRFIPPQSPKAEDPPISRQSGWASIDSRQGFTTQFQPMGYSQNPFAQAASWFTPVRY